MAARIVINVASVDQKMDIGILARPIGPGGGKFGEDEGG